MDWRMVQTMEDGVKNSVDDGVKDSIKDRELPEEQCREWQIVEGMASKMEA